MTEGLCTAKHDPLVGTSEIALTVKPLLERLNRARWAPAIPYSPPQQGIEQLKAFRTVFEAVAA
jgi:hypothetical protein